MPFFSSVKKEDKGRAHELSEAITLLMRSDPAFAEMVNGNTGGLNPRSVDIDSIREYLATQGIELPEGFGLRNMSQQGNPLGMVTPKSSIPGAVKLGMGAVGGLAGGALLGPALAGGGGASSAATSGLSLPGGIPASAGGAGLGGGSGAAGALGGVGGKVGGLLTGMKKLGLDPTALALGGMSLLGGDGQELKSFGGNVGAEKLLGRSMGMADELEQMVKKRQAGRAAPVLLPELPAQIGGGLGADPGLRPSAQQPGQVQRRKPEGGY